MNKKHDRLFRELLVPQTQAGRAPSGGLVVIATELLFAAGTSAPLMPSHWAELLSKTLFVGADRPLAMSQCLPGKPDSNFRGLGGALYTSVFIQLHYYRIHRLSLITLQNVYCLISPMELEKINPFAISNIMCLFH